MKKLIVAFAAAVLLAGCAKEPTCDYNACANAAPASEIQEVQTFLASKNITNAQRHCSGVFYVISQAGSGGSPGFCSTVDVSYVGRLEDGTIFDQTDTQNPSAVFSLRGVIPGWTNTIPLLQRTGKITLYIPPSLAYGAAGIVDRNTGRVIIPPNEILTFDVTLNNFN